MRALYLVLPLLFALTTSSCADLGWYARQGVGQVELLASARSVKRLLDDEQTPPDVRRRLSLVVAARRYAKEELGLAVKGQYRTVTFLDAPAVVYVVSAAPRTSLEAHTWDYPVVGALPYRGFFSLEQAEALAEELEADLDASVRPVSAYSMLGFLPDPILSPMLFRSDEAWIAETVFHELAHATIFAAGAGAFNEGLATFIGREGLRRFVAHHYGERSAIAERLEQVLADRTTYARAVGALAFDLRVLFAQTRAIDADEVLERKEQIFLVHQRHYREEVAPVMRTFSIRRARLPDNNAELSAYGMYTLQQHLYERAFAACSEEMRCLLRTLRRAAKADEPELALRDVLNRSERREHVLR